MISIEDKIWFCAFYEGEGSISNDKSNYNRIRISICQNDKTPLELGKKLWGGCIRNRVRQSKNKTCYGHEWIMNQPQALKFLEDIKPYMKIPYKINQMKTALNISQIKYERTFKCFFCDLEYANPQGRRRHEIQSHISKNEKYKCTDCIEEYITRPEFNDHLKTHTLINSTASADEKSVRDT